MNTEVIDGSHVQYWQIFMYKRKSIKQKLHATLSYIFFNFKILKQFWIMTIYNQISNYGYIHLTPESQQRNKVSNRWHSENTEFKTYNTIWKNILL